VRRIGSNGYRRVEHKRNAILYLILDLGLTAIPKINANGYTTEAAVHVHEHAKEKHRVHDVFLFGHRGQAQWANIIVDVVKAGLMSRKTQSLAFIRAKPATYSDQAYEVVQ